MKYDAISNNHTCLNIYRCSEIEIILPLLQQYKEFIAKYL